VNVFDLDRSLVGDYERFARSFTQIRSPDIRERVEEMYSSGRFWPEPLISINPHFERGASITDLVTDGSLHSETSSIFRVDGQPITLYRHRLQPIIDHGRATPECAPHARQPKADSRNAAKRLVYSITSSAAASSDCGMVRASAFAVFRLIVSSYLVGACTGRSAGFSPLRIRST